MGIDFRPGRAARFGRRHYREGAPHNNGIHFCPAPLPSREFSARSLCGMTQGARKRAARVEAISGDAATLALQSRKVWLLWWRQGCLGGMPKLAAYPSIRAKYRLGERLRPCPGKYGCRNCTRTCGACEDQIPNDTRCRRCGSMMTTEGPFCDGSGVLPAKRHRRCGWWLQTRTAMNATQRCGMPTTHGWFDCQNCGGSGWLMGRSE